jgi:hypothetical protein
MLLNLILLRMLATNAAVVLMGTGEAQVFLSLQSAAAELR